MNKSQDDIELLDLFIILWKSKLTFILFIFVSILIGVSLFINDKSKIVIKDPYYEAKLNFSINMKLPHNLKSTFKPDAGFNRVIEEYQKIFYSKDAFQEWKDKNLQSNITLNDFSNTKLRGYYYETKGENLFLKFKNMDDRHMLVQSSQIEVFDEVFSYSEHVSKLLNSNLYSYYKDLYEQIDMKFKEFNNTYSQSASADFIFEQIKIQNFLKQMDEGYRFIKIIDFDGPNNINKTPSIELSYLKLFVFAIFGGILGSIFIFVRNAIFKRFNKPT